MSQQEALPLIWPERYTSESFIIAASNAQAFNAIQNPQSWSSPVMLLQGEAASGKTHLAKIFQNMHQAFWVESENDIAKIIDNDAAFVVIDNADLIKSDETLFHLFNNILHRKARLLLTAKNNPENWIKLPDLLSRINVSHHALLQEPDEETIKLAYQKLFNDRGLFVDAKVLDYLTLRTERRFSSVYENVKKLDQLALQNRKRITIPLISESGIFA